MPFLRPYSLFFVDAKGRLQRHRILDLDETLPCLYPDGHAQATTDSAGSQRANQAMVAAIGDTARIMVGVKGDEHAHWADASSRATRISLITSA